MAELTKGSKMKTRSQAVEEALGMVGHSYPEGMCQKFTRECFDAPSVGDVDGDGDPDAEDGYKSEPLAARHDGDRTPPAGVPLYWEGGSNDNGHRAVSLGDGKIASTDAPTSGKVGVVDLDWVTRNWGLRYVGWTETISGQPIPRENPTKKPKEPRKGTDAAKALANLRSALRRAENNGYSERARELKRAINEILNAPKKR